jgi:hypothetical protein
MGAFRVVGPKVLRWVLCQQFGVVSHAAYHRHRCRRHVSVLRLPLGLQGSGSS